MEEVAHLTSKGLLLEQQWHNTKIKFKPNEKNLNKKK
jgi:hypothetical protein